MMPSTVPADFRPRTACSPWLRMLTLFGLATLPCLLPNLATAQGYEIELGLAAGLIDGNIEPDVEVNTGEEVFQVYPVPDIQPKNLLSEVPGEPFNDLEEDPKSFQAWKVPFYTVLGLPRDLADGAVGFVNHIPVLNSVVFVGYELVPTQIFLRDHRDWHRWPGTRNRNGHGMMDGLAIRDANNQENWANQWEYRSITATRGVTWGFFPSLKQWTWFSPSKGKLRRMERENEQLKERLDAINREYEDHNQKIQQRILEARSNALLGVEAGNGQEAVYRMLPVDRVYQIDEGGFALLITGLAMYAGEGPEWVEPMLWKRLREAQSNELGQAEKLMSRLYDEYPDTGRLGEALIYIYLILGQTDEAQAVALDMSERRPANREISLLALETSFANADREAVRQYATDITTTSDPRYAGLINARLALLDADAPAALEMLQALQREYPNDPQVLYFLGCASLSSNLVEAENPLELMRDGFNALERSALTAPGVSLRQKASRALSYARGVVDRLSANPELLIPDPDAGSEIDIAIDEDEDDGFSIQEVIE